MLKNQIHEWLKDGKSYTSVLPTVADYLNDQLREDQKATILDAGCGNGQLLNMLRDRGWDDNRLYGCDIEPTHVSMAKMNTRLDTIYQVDMADESLGELEGMKFAAIVAINWLHNDWRFKHAINVEPHKETDYLLLDKIMKKVLSIIDEDGWFVCDYRTCLPRYLIKTLDEFFSYVLSLGFTLHHSVEDVRTDTTKVVTWFFQMRKCRT